MGSSMTCQASTPARLRAGQMVTRLRGFMGGNHDQDFDKIVSALAVGLLGMTALTGAAWAQSVTITYLIPSGADDVAVATSLIDAVEAANPDINVEIENRPGGPEGDNLIKTRLATGAMPDVLGAKFTIWINGNDNAAKARKSRRNQ